MGWGPRLTNVTHFGLGKKLDGEMNLHVASGASHASGETLKRTSQGAQTAHGLHW